MARALLESKGRGGCRQHCCLFIPFPSTTALDGQGGGSLLPRSQGKRPAGSPSRADQGSDGAVNSPLLTAVPSYSLFFPLHAKGGGWSGQGDPRVSFCSGSAVRVTMPGPPTAATNLPQQPGTAHRPRPVRCSQVLRVPLVPFQALGTLCMPDLGCVGAMAPHQPALTQALAPHRQGSRGTSSCPNSLLPRGRQEPGWSHLGGTIIFWGNTSTSVHPQRSSSGRPHLPDNQMLCCSFQWIVL